MIVNFLICLCEYIKINNTVKMSTLLTPGLCNSKDLSTPINQRIRMDGGLHKSPDIYVLLESKKSILTTH